MRHYILNCAEPLTSRWYPMRYHPQQAAYAASPERWVVNYSARRTGKSEIAKRILVRRALTAHRADGNPWHSPHPDPRYFIAAPTVQQVKSIYWEDLLTLIPPPFLFGRPNASSLTVRLINGARIQLLGVDRPERAEGLPFDGGLCDEFGNWKPDAWAAHIRPTLVDRQGWAHFLGVPEGRNHYYDLKCDAIARRAEAQAAGRPSDWGVYHWTCAEVLPVYLGAAGLDEIERAREELDEVTFRQEMEGSFETFTGRTYYSFGDDNKRSLTYDPRRPLRFCFDFNVEPCVAVVVQELEVDGREATGVLSEVYIPRGGNLLMVCDKLHADYPTHADRIVVYGDATGGARGAGKLLGSEWEIVRRKLRALYAQWQITSRVPSQNPRPRDCIASTNSRCRSFDGRVHLYVDPTRAPHVVKDLEGVRTVKGGSGEIDKSNLALTHLTDALSYYLAREFPIKKRYVSRRSRLPGRGGREDGR